MAIKMTPNELRALSETVTEIRNSILDQVDNMNSKISAETAEWDGQSKEQYFSDYEAILPTLQKTFPEVIEDLSKKLKFAADKLEEADQDIASAIKG